MKDPAQCFVNRGEHSSVYDTDCMRLTCNNMHLTAVNCNVVQT